MTTYCRDLVLIPAVLALSVSASFGARADDAAGNALPRVEVIGASPLVGAGIDRDRVPANVQVISGEAFDHRVSPDLMSGFERSMAGVSISDQGGNPYQRDINYRGFTASPIPGTEQGLAVYQNGVRINEVFGDIVNWDFIPEGAIARTVLLPSTALYGLNALGGAITVEMEDGFSHPGVEGEIRGGSFGRLGTSFEAGHRFDQYATFAAVDLTHDHGWRNQSGSQLKRAYGDIGYRDGASEVHVSAGAASNVFGVAAATPVELLAGNWSSIYTVPQNTKQDVLTLTGTGNWKTTDQLSLQANAYYRGFWQSHNDGNGTNALNSGCPDPTTLCFPDTTGNLIPLTDTTGNPVAANGSLASSVLGEIDRTWTTSSGFGGALQATHRLALAEGRTNQLTAGLSLDRGRSHFTSTSELGTINQDQFPNVTGTGIFIDVPTGDVAPVGVTTTSTLVGAFVSDTYDATARLAITGGLRINRARITIADRFGTDPGVAGDHTFTRANPNLGAALKLGASTVAYLGYSEANRAPTPLELACADPNRPCLVDNSLVADPDLKQVVAHSIEAGLRGNLAVGAGDGSRLAWNAGVFSNRISSDILHTPATANGLGVFANIATTRRRGFEGALSFRTANWGAYANLTVMDATYRDAITLASANNPAADANGNVQVAPGNRIPGIPRLRIKAGADARITDKGQVGVDVIHVGPQYLVGDDGNQNPQMNGYTVVNLNGQWDATSSLEFYIQVRNLFQKRYYTYGTYFETDTFPYLGLTDPRTFLPGAPRAFYAGARLSF